MSSFSKEMRLATRQPHALSDALANSKLVLALSDETVWADALVVFYDVFKCLEGIKETIKMPQLESLFVDDRLLRTSAFEKDLQRYFGNDWKNCTTTRPEVLEYVKHINSLVDTQPILLLAYFYHLYMGFMSGGQIIKTKRKLRKFSIFNIFRLINKTQDNIDWTMEFPNLDISATKKKMKKSIDDIAETLTEEERQGLLDESKLVFMYNNSVIKTIKGTNRVVLQKIMYSSLILIASIATYFYFIKN